MHTSARRSASDLGCWSLCSRRWIDSTDAPPGTVGGGLRDGGSVRSTNSWAMRSATTRDTRGDGDLRGPSGPAWAAAKAADSVPDVMEEVRLSHSNQLVGR